MDGRNYTLGKGGWSGREGQPPGSSEIVVRLTLEGESGLWEDASRLGNNRWGTPVDLSRAGPTDAGDDWIHGPIQCRRDYGAGRFLVGLSVRVVAGIKFTAVAGLLGWWIGPFYGSISSGTIRAFGSG